MKRSRTAPHDTLDEIWSATAKFQMQVDAFFGVCELSRVSSSGVVQSRTPYALILHAPHAGELIRVCRGM